MEHIFSPTTAQAYLILVREGLEALLILAILASAIRKAGAPQQLKSLYAGALAALGASGALAVVFFKFNGGDHVDWLEAATMLIAAALLFYVSGWLFVKKDVQALQQNLKANAQKALSKGTVWAMASVAFFSVLREGAETVLMLYGLLASANGAVSSLTGGIVAATFTLAALYLVIQKATLRLPLRPIFLITSAFLFLTGLHLVVEGIGELQELGWLPFSAIVGELTWEAVIPAFIILNVAGLATLVHTQKEQEKKHTATKQSA